MISKKEKLYRQEIEELTDFVQNDENWVDLRNILIESKYNLFNTLLVSFMKDEEEMEYGVIVTKDKKVFEYERSTARGESNINHFRIKEITESKEERTQYPQIEVALKMIDEGYLKKTNKV